MINKTYYLGDQSTIINCNNSIVLEITKCSYNLWHERAHSEETIRKLVKWLRYKYNEIVSIIKHI